MAKITVCFSRIDTAEQIAGILRDSGYEIARVCTSGDEVIRTYSTYQDGILVSGYRLNDRLLESFAEDLNDNIEILCLAKPEQLNQIASKRIFRLPLPSSRPVIQAAVEMMIQLHYQKLPSREPKTSELITKAKEYLVETKGFTEPQAHRFMQRQSMRFGIRMELVAKRILENREL